MSVPIALLFAQVPKGWLLGPRDLVAVPTRTILGIPLREDSSRYQAERIPGEIVIDRAQ